MSGEYGYVTVHHTTDPAQGEVLAELLRNEGIAARFIGAASTLIGIAKDMASMRVEVPADEEVRAREFLRALEDTAVAAESGKEARPAPPGESAPDRPERRRNVGLAVTVVATLLLISLGIVLYNLR